ncbi:MAG: hypothetical protein IID61_05895 [SAR324 cluster bacterium]|nr:hypothetical protein [SAR324 cluster bacterium]
MKRVNYSRNHSGTGVALACVIGLAVGLIFIFAKTTSALANERVYGDRVSLGDGQMETYIEFNGDGIPAAIGVEFGESLFANLPQGIADGYNCWDKNGDGKLSLNPPYECVAGHHRVLFLPKHDENIPFNWVLLNWNPGGHIPPGVFDVPHFDIHFYIMDYVANSFIRPGPCGPELVNCDDFKKGQIPIPPANIHPDFKNVHAVAPRMGNHLIDVTAPEFRPRPPDGDGHEFTYAFIFGAYDGHITFYEPMVTVAYFQSHPNECAQIKLPSEYEISGYYPTEYCMRYAQRDGRYTVSLEGFVERKAGRKY